MNIEFKYLDSFNSHALLAKSDDGVELEIFFDVYGDAEVILINDHEMNVNSDDFKGLYVRFGDIVPVQTVIEEANKQIEDIVAQTEQEQADDEAMAVELSSPYLTGRF